MQQVITEQQWFTGDGERCKVDLVEAMTEVIKVAPINHRRIMIGTDGQRRKRQSGIDFVTVVAIHNQGKGGFGYWARNRFSERFSLYQKLQQETWQSLEVAFILMDLLPKDNTHSLEIHVDANPNEKWASSKYHKALSGMVTGQGFKAILKPDAWVASHAADHLVKGKYEGR